MAKFDVYRMHSGEGYLLDCQADFLSNLNTRFVVPIIAAEAAPVQGERLNPTFLIEGRVYAMVTQYASSVRKTDLRDFVISLEEHDLKIGNALDLLISGF